jgi:type I restriction enzyme S subunit
MRCWQTKQLGEVLQLNYGKGLSVQERPPGSIPVYESNGIVGFHNSALVQRPGVIIGRNGSAGEVYLCCKDFYSTDKTYYITPQDAPGAEIDILYYLLKHLNLKCIRSDVDIPGLNREMACFEPVSQHSGIPEQKAIAHSLSTAQRASDTQEPMIQTSTELKKALMQKLFTEGLRGESQKETKIGLVPEGWEICTIGDVAMIQSGGTPSRETPENWNGGTIPWVKTGEFNYYTITDTEEKITANGLANSSARIFPKGTLLMAMYGQGITRGRVGLLGIEAATNQACAAIIPLDPLKLSTQFLYFFLEHNYEKLRQLGHGANQKNMSATLIRSLSLALPPMTDQTSIAHVFNTFEIRLRIADKNKSELSNFFRSLLRNLMTGEISTRPSHPFAEFS